jgi:arabinofuranan 3-O-arabinosyltransferase
VLWCGVAAAFAFLLFWAYHRNDAADLQPVWQATHAFLHVGSPYDVPLFVYPPSALLLLAPFGLIGFEAARLGFTVVDGAMVLLAASLGLRLFDVSIRSSVAPMVFLASILFAPVGSTLHLGNVNGLVAVGEVGALLAAARGRWGLSGWLLGLTFAIKPVLLPLLLIPILWRRWGAVARAIALPMGLSVLALPFTAHGSEFFSTTVPFLLKGNAQDLRDVNVSIQGVVAFVGLSNTLTICFRLLTAAVCAYLVTVRVRRGGDDEVSRLVDCSALILIATFLCFSFSWNYYALYLLPPLLGIALGRSAAHRWALWLPLLFVGSPDVFLWRHAGSSSLTHLASARVTAGYLLLMGAFALVLVARKAPKRARLSASGPTPQASSS